jgi:Helicase C-terminal domain
VFNAMQLESSKQPFIECQSAVAVVANRYDGIDLIEDDCRLLMADGLPGGANLQERFFVSRVTAQQLLDDRILTRLVQGFGRCTRSPNDYAAVVILGETLSSYLFKKERREFFHPEIQAELEFGIEQSKEVSVSDLIDNLNHFFARDAEWEGADQAILTQREGLTQKTFASSKDLADVVSAELAYQYAIWDADFTQALEHCRAVLGKLNHEDLRGYRALWLYLAGSAAWLAHANGYLPDDEQVKVYYRRAQAAAPVLRWLVHLQANAIPTVTTGLSQLDSATTAIVERLECVLEQIGTIHDGKFDVEETAILTALLQTADGKAFEAGHVRLGRLLGYEADNSDDDAAPDPWWIADDTVFVFEDHAEAGGNTVFSATKARQAASHPDWVRENLKLPPTTEIIPVVITPCTKTTKGAMPSLRKVRYWALDDFCAWVKNALRVIRDIRRTFPGVGDLEWRTQAAARLRDANITPQQLNDKLSTSCADAMRVESLEEEVT